MSKHNDKQDQSRLYISVIVLSVIPVIGFLQNNDLGQCVSVRLHFWFSRPSEQSVNCSPLIAEHVVGSAQFSEFVFCYEKF